MTTHLDIDSIRTDGGTQPRAELDFVTVADYADDMRAGSQFPPVVVFYDGSAYWLADGYHRVEAVKQLGERAIAADVRQGTLDDARWFSYGVNKDHGLRRTNEDKRRAVEAALQHPFSGRYSDEQIARHVGVHRNTVLNYRRDQPAQFVQDSTRIVTRNGVTYEMQTANIGQREPAAPFSVPFVPTAEDYADPYGGDEPEVFEVATPRVSHQLINQSTSNEWYTPAPFIEAARAVMGRIDLDPASCEYANRTVQALVYYTQDDDGYAQQWHGAVWLNPPYGKEEGENESNQARWSRKLLDEYEARRVREAVLLVNAVTGNQWFRPLKAFPICFPDSRIRFYNEETEAGQPTHSNALVYIGPNVARFVEAFSQFGPVMMPVRVEGERVCLKI